VAVGDGDGDGRAGERMEQKWRCSVRCAACWCRRVSLQGRKGSTKKRREWLWVQKYGMGRRWTRDVDPVRRWGACDRGTDRQRRDSDQRWPVAATSGLRLT
jgi:hypothetical protein